MSHLTICGTSPLRGEVSVQCAKNSVLPVLAAALLPKGCSRIRHCPHLRDVDAAIAILRHLGCTVTWDGDDLVVDAAFITRCDIPPALMGRCRASVVFLGALLARCGEASIAYPGGCELGPRPIDLHLSSLRALGAQICLQGDTLRATGSLMGTELLLPFPSVGATENAMLAATAAEGVTVIGNAAREPEIVDLQQFLQTLGAEIHGAGTSTITVRGRSALHGGDHRCIGDRIAAATYLCAAAACGGEITVRDLSYRHLAAVTTALHQAGCRIRCGETYITLSSDGMLTAPPPVRTAPYPGFPTDAQPLLMAALVRAKGATLFVENLFTGRYSHVPQLLRMGADIRLEGRVAMVCGTAPLYGASVEATDLRCGAALAIAALQAEGETHLYGTEHIFRGYEDLSGDLQNLGAAICYREHDTP